MGMEAPNLEKPSNHSKPSSKSKFNLMQNEKGKEKVVLDQTISSKEDSNPNSNRNAVRGSKNRVFSCKYCTMKFHSSQALGGHQNAHRRERATAWRKQQQQQHHHDAAALSLPMHGSSQGMQVVHSSIIHNHKPIYGGVPMYGRQPLHQQPAVGRLVAEVGGGATRFHGGWRVVPAAVDGIIGSVRWDSSSELKTGSQLDLSLKL